MTDRPTARWDEPVDPRTFAEADAEVDRLYTNGQYQQAYELLERTWPGLPDGALHPTMHDCVRFKASLAARCGHAELAFTILQAILRSGFSSNLTWSVFDSLRSLDGFADFERENEALLARERAEATRKLEVCVPEGFDPEEARPLCLLLHGDGESADILKGQWSIEPLLARGFVVAFVQSSQLSFTNHYAWLPDPSVAWTDVRAAFQELRSTYRIVEDQVLLAGFSGGAITAVDLVFGEAIPAVGFICLCPEFMPEHFTSEAVASARDRGVRGVFLEGELVWPLDDERAMMEEMAAADFPIKLILNEDIGHSFPADFPARLDESLDHILIAG